MMVEDYLFFFVVIGICHYMYFTVLLLVGISILKHIKMLKQKKKTWISKIGKGTYLMYDNVEIIGYDNY